MLIHFPIIRIFFRLVFLSEPEAFCSLSMLDFLAFMGRFTFDNLVALTGNTAYL